MSNLQKRALYLGLDPSNYSTEKNIFHLPLIQIIPFPLNNLVSVLNNFNNFTHILFTSKSSVTFLIQHLEKLYISHEAWQKKIVIAVGKATAKTLNLAGIQTHIIAKNETAEGLIAEIDQLDTNSAHFFWPHSALSRPLIKEYLQEKNLNFSECILYTTESVRLTAQLNLNEFDEIIFTSPSTVDAFFKNFQIIPSHILLTSIGPVTAEYLKSKLA